MVGMGASKSTRRRTAWFLACAAATAGASAPGPEQSAGSIRSTDPELAVIRSALSRPGSVGAADELGLTWVRYDVIKSRNRLQYVPFTVAIDPRKSATSTLIVYWRVMAKSDARGTGQNAKAIDGVRSMTVQPGTALAYISQSFEAPSGAYQMTVVVKESSGGRTGAATGKLAAVTEDVLVPDYWNGEFTTSPIIAAEKLTPLIGQMSPAERSERPYAMQGWEIIPRFGNRFTRRMEFWTLVQIYNPKLDADNKPDVRVEYRYFLKQGTGEKLFNQTAPQTMNRSTLPPQLNFAAGDQLESTQGLPIAAFPFGTYRLEVRITDALSKETLTRELEFTVTPQ